mgnify:FL=1
MKLSLYSISSSSSGNCYAVSSGETSILSDCGISLKKITSGLSELGVGSLGALLISHAHSDHIKCADAVMKKFGVPLYITKDALKESGLSFSGEVNIITPEVPFSVGNIKVTPFSVSHDASTVAFTFEAESDKASLITDTGVMTDGMLSHLKGSSSVIIEANHDVSLLMSGSYPYFLKARIKGERGHLSNDDCAKACLSLLNDGTTSFMLAHLSSQNNTPETAFGTVDAVLSRSGKKYTLKTALKNAPCAL